MSKTIEDLKAEVEETSENARAVASAAGDIVRNVPAAVAARVAQKAAHTATSLRDGTTDRLDSARTQLSDAGYRLAYRMQRAAENEPSGALKSRVLEGAATRVAKASRAVGGRSVSDMAAEVQAMARRNPGPFILGAAVAGFALARLLQPRPNRRP